MEPFEGYTVSFQVSKYASFAIKLSGYSFEGRVYFTYSPVKGGEVFNSFA